MSPIRCDEQHGGAVRASAPLSRGTASRRPSAPNWTARSSVTCWSQNRPDNDVLSFGTPNLFFGGCQAVRRDPVTGHLDGGGDGRRGGAVVVA
jgi:hypothetical protein